MPKGVTASWATRSLPVLATDSRMGAVSSGATVRRSITSTDVPSSAASCSAAASASCTIRDTDTTVTSLPSRTRSEEHTSELQSLMRISYAVFCLKKKNKKYQQDNVAEICSMHITHNLQT